MSEYKLPVNEIKIPEAIESFLNKDQDKSPAKTVAVSMPENMNNWLDDQSFELQSMLRKQGVNRKNFKSKMVQLAIVAIMTDEQLLESIRDKLIDEALKE